MPDAPYPEVPPDFGHWLAGFIDGEGCFYIQRVRRHTAAGHAYWNYLPGLRVALRDDDTAIIEEIRRVTGIGSIYWHTVASRPHAIGRPCTIWDVHAKAESQHLVTVLDRYPLRSKKARDYAIWRRAVAEWAKIGKRSGLYSGAADWRPLEAMYAEIRACRAYESVPLSA